ncbi:MAG: TonB family protein [Aquincola sp.]|nr:TonB family protein [Aquincola sp.]
MPTISVANWRGTLVVHLDRFKRFPGNGSTGLATVAITIDRSGRVTGPSLASSPGGATLDAKGISMVRRSSPMPALPEGMGSGAISRTVSVRLSR